MKIQTLFDMGDQVIIDNDKDILVIVLACTIRGNNVAYEVSWFNNGQLQSAWVEEWRLSLWEE